ncbi:MAG: hypothetical protein IPG05_15835 [Gemmatimonadetes bacterium]|nr:hypothetical protein [Gemmatimonadota bacterium]
MHASTQPVPTAPSYVQHSLPFAHLTEEDLRYLAEEQAEREEIMAILDGIDACDEVDRQMDQDYAEHLDAWHEQLMLDLQDIA